MSTTVKSQVDIVLAIKTELEGLNKTIQKMDAVQKRSQKLSSTLKKGIGFAAGALGAFSFATALREAVSTLADFEAQMKRVEVLTGATGSQLEALKKLAAELGKTTQFTASQAADAMGFLAQAGFEANTILAVMPDTLNLAAAAQIDLGEAADIVTNILTGYRLEADKLGEANDILVATFTDSNTTLTEIGESMKFVGPIAAALGIEFKETSAAIGLLGNAGLKGELAGTALRNILINLTKPTTEAAGVIKRLGIEVTDSAGKMRPLIGIIRDLEESGASTSDIIAIFGKRAGPAMSALIGQGSDALERFIEKLDRAGGTTERVAGVQMEGLLGQWKEFKSAVEGLVIQLGESGLLGVLTEMAKEFAFVARWVGEIFETVEAFSGANVSQFRSSLQAAKTVEDLEVIRKQIKAQIRNIVQARKEVFQEVVKLENGIITDPVNTVIEELNKKSANLRSEIILLKAILGQTDRAIADKGFQPSPGVSVGGGLGEGNTGSSDIEQKFDRLAILENRLKNLGESTAEKIVRLQAEALELKTLADAAFAGGDEKEGKAFRIQELQRLIELALAEADIAQRKIQLTEGQDQLDFQRLSKAERMAQLIQDISTLQMDLASVTDEGVLADEKRLDIAEKLLDLEKKLNSEMTKGSKQFNQGMLASANLLGDLAGAFGQAAVSSQSFGQLAGQVFRQLIAQMITTLLKLIVMNLILRALGVPLRFDFGGAVNPKGEATGIAKAVGGVFGKGKLSGGLVTGGPQLIPVNEDGRDEFVTNAFGTRKDRPLLEMINRNPGPESIMTRIARAQKVASSGKLPTALSLPSPQPSPASFGAASGSGGAGAGESSPAEPSTFIFVDSRKEAQRVLRSTAGKAQILEIVKQGKSSIGIPA